MPVVGRCDHHRVDIIARQDLFMRRGHPAVTPGIVLVYPPLRVERSRLVHIANGNNAKSLLWQEGVLQEPTTANADSDHPQSHGFDPLKWQPDPSRSRGKGSSSGEDLTAIGA